MLLKHTSLVIGCASNPLKMSCKMLMPMLCLLGGESTKVHLAWQKIPPDRTGAGGNDKCIQ